MVCMDAAAFIVTHSFSLPHGPTASSLSGEVQDSERQSLKEEGLGTRRLHSQSLVDRRVYRVTGHVARLLLRTSKGCRLSPCSTSSLVLNYMAHSVIVSGRKYFFLLSVDSTA